MGTRKHSGFDATSTISGSHMVCTGQMHFIGAASTRYTALQGLATAQSSEKDAVQLIPVSGAFLNLYVRPNINTLDGDTDFWLKVNGNDTILSGSMLTGSTALASDTTNKVAVSGGSLVSIVFNSAKSGAGVAADIAYGVEFVRRDD